MQGIKKIGKKILALIYFSWLAPLSVKKIISAREKIIDPEEAYNWTKEFKFGFNIRGLNINFQPAQAREEILALADELRNEPPKIILEIGTATGGTLFIFTLLASSDGEIISIDLPFGKYGAGYLKYRIPLFKAFAKKTQKIELLRENSHLSQTVDKLRKILGEREIDFLFIDGDHSYEGVKSDFYSYLPFVKPGGKIAFHDIVENDLDKSFGTQKFWKEIRGNYQHKEFIRPSAQKTGFGIGLIIIGEKTVDTR